MARSIPRDPRGRYRLGILLCGAAAAVAVEVLVMRVNRWRNTIEQPDEDAMFGEVKTLTADDASCTHDFFLEHGVMGRFRVPVHAETCVVKSETPLVVVRGHLRPDGFHAHTVVSAVVPSTVSTP